MRVLLVEMISRRLIRELAGHEVSTVQREGLAGIKNGALLDAIEPRCDVFITMDKGMRHQQQMLQRPYGIIEIRAFSTAIRALLPIVPAIRAASDTVRPGEIVTVAAASTVDALDAIEGIQSDSGDTDP